MGGGHQTPTLHLIFFDPHDVPPAPKTLRSYTKTRTTVLLSDYCHMSTYKSLVMW